MDELLKLYTNLHLSQTARMFSPSSPRSATSLSKSPSHQHVYSSQKLVEADIPNVGCFSAYSDSRIIVTFVDRTILELDGEAQFCNILDSFGESITLRVAKPLSYGKYVRPAMHFRRWAMADEQGKRVMKREREMAVEKLKKALSRGQLYLIKQGIKVSDLS